MLIPHGDSSQHVSLYVRVFCNLFSDFFFAVFSLVVVVYATFIMPGDRGDENKVVGLLLSAA